MISRNLSLEGKEVGFVERSTDGTFLELKKNVQY